jgi:hypothetical protein
MKPKQTTLNKFLGRKQLSSDDSDSAYSEESEGNQRRKTLYWSRVQSRG